MAVKSSQPRMTVVRAAGRFVVLVRKGEGDKTINENNNYNKNRQTDNSHKGGRAHIHSGMSRFWNSRLKRAL